MKLSSKRKLITTISAIALALIVLGLTATVAYLRDSSQKITNYFDPSDINVTVTENTGDHYKVIPGSYSEKDPVVTLYTEVDAYLFLEVTDNTDGKIIYYIAEGWEELEGYDNVFYRVVEADATNEQEFQVLEGDKVYYPSSIEVGDIVLDETTLSFQAVAIQMVPFDSAQQAYVAASAEKTDVSDAASLKAALAAGKAAVLTADIDMGTEYLDITKNAVIFGEGHKITSDASAAVRIYGDAEEVIISETAIEGIEDATGWGIIIYNGAEVKISNSSVTARYPIYVADNATGASISVENSSVTSGWNAYQSNADDVTFTAVNSTFNGYNPYTSGNNDFALFVLGSKNLQTNAAIDAKDNVITLTDCVVNTSTAGKAEHIFWTRGKNETFQTSGTTFTYNDSEITAADMSMLDETHLSYWWSSGSIVYSDRVKVDINGEYIYDGPLPQSSADAIADFTQYETRN